MASDDHPTPLAETLPDDENQRIAWQLAVDAAGVGAFDWDLETRELRWDDRLLELFGLRREEFGGTIEAFNDCVHPEDRDRVGHALQTAIETCGEYAADYRVVWPDGTIRWIAARGRALCGPDGVATRVLGAAYDDTASVDGEARVSRVLEAMPTAFFQLDPDWRFTFVNSAGRRLLGPVTEELVGGNIWELFPAALGSDFERHYREAAETGEPVSFDAYYPPPLDAWYEVRAWPTHDGLSVYFNDVTDRHAAQVLLDREARRSTLMADVAVALTGNLEVETGVGRLAQLLVPEVADWCIVSLVEDEEGRDDWRLRLRDVGWWHADAEMREVLDGYAAVRLPALADTSFVAQALEREEPVVVPSDAARAIERILTTPASRDLLRRLDPFSAAVVPLQGRGRTVGVLSVFRGADREPMTADDVGLLRDVAARAGLHLDNARLYREQRDLAEGLQRSLLTAPPEPEGVELAVRYEAAAQAAQVGGDWYDAFVQDDGATVLVIGDVVGHDLAAAAAMGQIRSLLRGIAVHTGDGPAAVLHGVDKAVEVLDLGVTATAAVARLDRTDAGAVTVRWSNAGHPPPALVGADGKVRLLDDGEPGLLLGLEPDVARVEADLDLPPGATLVLFTDGLVERRDLPLDEGLDLLRVALATLATETTDLDALCDGLLRRMLPDGLEDDVALVAVRLRR